MYYCTGIKSYSMAPANKKLKTRIAMPCNGPLDQVFGYFLPCLKVEISLLCFLPASAMSEKKNSAPSLVERSGEEPRFLSGDVNFGGESSLPPPLQLTPEQEQRLWRKIDMRLLPILSLMYLLSFSDRGLSCCP